MDYWYSVLREMDTLQSKFLFSKGPSLNEADTVRPNFPLQFQWRANWLLTQCSLKKPDTMLLEFLTLLTQCSFREIDRKFAVHCRIGQLCCHNFSQQSQERVDWVAVNIFLCQLHKGSTLCYQTTSHGVTRYCQTLSFSEGLTALSVKGWLTLYCQFFSNSAGSTLCCQILLVKGWHFAVDSFSEGMTLCCQTISVKGWHFAVKLFQSRDDTLLSDSFSEGMTFCCQTLSVKGWHFAVRLFQWRDDTLLSNSLSKGMTLCCQSFSSSNKPIDILLPNFLFHWRVNWHSAVALSFTETWLTLSCQTFSFSEEQIDTLLSNILFQRRVDWQFDVIFFPLSEGITLLSNLLYQRMVDWHLTVTLSLQQSTEHFAVISFGFLPFSAKADALPSTFLSRCNEPNWWNHFFTLCYPLKKNKTHSRTQYSATLEPKSHMLGLRGETAISGMRALHFTACHVRQLCPFLMQ